MRKLLTIAACGLLVLASCGKKANTVPEKPVLTADMYSVTCQSETGEVCFKILQDNMSPFWTVTDPSGIKETFTQREVVKTYKSNGLYTGSLIAYGTLGQTDPVSFEFTVNTPEPEDSDVAKAKAALSGKTFKVSAFGWWGEGWEYFDDPVPEFTADDRITFAADGTLVISLGETPKIYNDGVAEGEELTVSETPRWAITKVGEDILLVFSDGGFPLMLAGNGSVSPDNPAYHLGLDGKWTVASVEEGVVRVEIYQDFNEQWLTVFLSPIE